MFKVPEKFRLTSGPMGSNESHGNNGVFFVRNRRFKHVFNVQASDGLGWEHVSVSTAARTPNWTELCYIKSLFWDDDDFVVQMHVPREDWINNNSNCLHLWRKGGTNDFCQRPPSIMVGVKGLNL